MEKQMQKMREELNANPVGANCIRPCFEGMTRNKGITLIALIITIIVMLILVGVTINIALNGGLFVKAEKVTYQTEASTVKEQLEIAKAVEIANNGGNLLSDYSIITVEKLDGLDANTKNEYKDKILVNTAGDICYNPETVTNTQERIWLKEIGINEYVETNIGNLYTFTIGELANRGILAPADVNGTVMTTEEEFWPENISEDLKNSTIIKNMGGNEITTYNITCLNTEYSNQIELQQMNPFANSFAMYVYDGNIVFAVFNESINPINMGNYTNYADLTFIISMAE